MAQRQKPAIAAWIQRERKRLGLSTEELSARLALVGAKAGEQTISVWESYANRKPSDDNLDALERIFGSQAPNRETATPEGMAELVAALRDQTEAINGLVGVLLGTPSEAGRAAVERLVDRLASRLQNPDPVSTGKR